MLTERDNDAAITVSGRIHFLAIAAPARREVDKDMTVLGASLFQRLVVSEPFQSLPVLASLICQNSGGSDGRRHH
jgi:hypothetical protein